MIPATTSTSLQHGHSILIEIFRQDPKVNHRLWVETVFVSCWHLFLCREYHWDLTNLSTGGWQIKFFLETDKFNFSNVKRNLAIGATGFAWVLKLRRFVEGIHIIRISPLISSLTQNLLLINKLLSWLSYSIFSCFNHLIRLVICVFASLLIYIPFYDKVFIGPCYSITGTFILINLFAHFKFSISVSITFRTQTRN